jgi:hypothetical protein
LRQGFFQAVKSPRQERGKMPVMANMCTKELYREDKTARTNSTAGIAEAPKAGFYVWCAVLVLMLAQMRSFTDRMIM